HSIAQVISEIADLKLSEKIWPELLDFLIKASDSPAAHEREVVIFILYTLMNNVVGTFAENLPQIYNLFAKALQDPKSLEVRATTVQALGRVSELMDADKKSSIVSFVLKKCPSATLDD
ncbi:hypothetical protein BY996DRAFT_4587152, partial [Phakopsora pachyrhizi]